MADCGAARCVPASEAWAHVQNVVQSARLEGGLHAHMQSAGLAFVSSQQGSAEATMTQLATLPCWPVQPMPAIEVQQSGPWVVWTCADASKALGHALDTSAFEPDHYKSLQHNLATGSGRGQALKVEQGNHVWVLRHYRRGGFVARWVKDTYPSAPTEQTRAMQELLLLRHMTSLGLPVPTAVAAHCQRKHSWLGDHSRYRADILIQHIPSTRNLVQCLREGPLPTETWQAVGRAIALLHSKQIFHSDLNAHNILLDDAGQVWLVDFDKCGLRAGSAWKLANLARLNRSLNKVCATMALTEPMHGGWNQLTSAYQAHEL
jgi:3-deoxy-D-manno-octulosonic-acid transferase